MLQRDYVLRLIQQFANSLGAIVALKKARRLDEAEAAIAKVTKNLVGLELVTLRALPAQHLSDLFRSGGQLDLGKCLVAADILAEHAEVAELGSDEEEAFRSWLTALRLYLDVFSAGDPERIPDRESYGKKIQTLVSRFSDYELDPATKTRLFRFREVNGQFADAEDLLYELLDAEEGAYQEGLAFYRRLLSKKDEELEAGNLPRSEVEEGLASLECKPR